MHWFASIDDAQQKIDAFRWDYNEHHPHRSLKGLSPREFAERMLQTAAGSLSLVDRKREAPHLGDLARSSDRDYREQVIWAGAPAFAA